MQTPITEEMIDYYQENGFVKVDDMLTGEELSELRGIVDELMSVENDHLYNRVDKTSTYYRVLNQKVNGWRDHALMGKYSFHPRFAESARLLAKTNGIRLFHDHILFKNPGDSKPTPWHQDFPSWPLNESGALSIWIALDDVDENNGCMMFIPGSHKVGKLRPQDLTKNIELEEFGKGTGVEKRTPIICRMKAGSCTFHNGLTFHYAHANRTDRPRRVMSMIYMPDGSTYDGKEHVVTTGWDHPIGQPLKGPFHPLLVKTSL